MAVARADTLCKQQCSLAYRKSWPHAGFPGYLQVYQGLILQPIAISFDDR